MSTLVWPDATDKNISVGIPCSDPSDEPHPLLAAHPQAKALEDEYEYNYVDPKALKTLIDNGQEKGSLHYASKVVAPPASRQEGNIVDSDVTVQSKRKPIVPPKPAKKQSLLGCGSSSNDRSSTADSSADTSTGDSGYADAKKYLKELPPKVLPRPHYTPLIAAQREQVANYTAINPIPCSEKGNES